MEITNSERTNTGNPTQDCESTKWTLIQVTSPSSKGLAFAVLLFVAMAVSVIVLAVALTTCSRDPYHVDDVTPTPPTDDDVEAARSKSGKYRFASVAADSALCSRIGTVKNEVITLDSREVAPLAATEDMFVNDSKSSTLGGLAIAVPGEIAGYAAVHARYGKLSWSELFKPTIELCQQGFVISKNLRKAMVRQEKNVRTQPGLRELFIKDDGSMREAGDVIRMPLLARTLRQIATYGSETFYNGSLADDIVRDIQDRRGVVTKEDLSGYKALWKRPVLLHLANGDYTLYGPPPPSSSVIVNYILGIMDGYNVSSKDKDTLEDRVLLDHRLVEAMKFGYGKRSYLGDEDFVNITQWLTLLQREDYAIQTKLKIDDDKVLPIIDYDLSFDNIADSGTSHVSVYGRDGSAVSVTSTINTYFGSKVLGNRTGILFNNEMDDFSTPGTVNAYNYAPSPSNYITPGKRPMSSMSPTIVLNERTNQVVEVVGASGGSRIIAGTLQVYHSAQLMILLSYHLYYVDTQLFVSLVIVNTLWLGYNVTEALDQPRFYHQLLPNEIIYEPTWPLGIRKALAKRGHVLRAGDRIQAIVQIIKDRCLAASSSRDRDVEMCLRAASDVRKGGAPDGY
ncbi:hypothetical protein LSH36_186g00047 [Paralvinella palmiformis]|uniref:Uncharacterized protein n=1 Tax=Paralvinella palmiformis TaxID=53620 RepID=A0AAD9N6V4_9ANNE|nr:hypothetical protein LSH36_186g00047 [Paralvinella palmiformis]